MISNTSSLSSQTQSSTYTPSISKKQVAIIAICALSCLCALACEFALVSNFLDPSWAARITHLSSSTLIDIAAPVLSVALGVLGVIAVRKTSEPFFAETSEPELPEPPLPLDREILKKLPINENKPKELYLKRNYQEESKTINILQEDYIRDFCFCIKTNTPFTGTSEEFIKKLSEDLDFFLAKKLSSSGAEEEIRTKRNQVLDFLHQGVLSQITSSISQSLNNNDSPMMFCTTNQDAIDPPVYRLVMEEDKDPEVEIFLPITICNAQAKNFLHAECYAKIKPLTGETSYYLKNLEQPICLIDINMEDLHTTGVLTTSKEVYQQLSRDSVGSDMFLGKKRLGLNLSPLDLQNELKTFAPTFSEEDLMRASRYATQAIHRDPLLSLREKVEPRIAQEKVNQSEKKAHHTSHMSERPVRFINVENSNLIVYQKIIYKLPSDENGEFEGYADLVKNTREPKYLKGSRFITRTKCSTKSNTMELRVTLAVNTDAINSANDSTPGISSESEEDAS